MHAPHGADHVAPLLLALQRVAGTLQELDVPVAPDHHVERAEGRRVHEEADVARVQPVVAAGDHDPGHVGRRRGGSCDGEPGAVARGTPRGTARPLRRGGRPERRILVLLADHERGALRAPASGRSSATGSVDDRGALHPAERLREEQPLGGGEAGRGAGELARPARPTGRGHAAARGRPPPGGSARRRSGGCPGSPPRRPVTGLPAVVRAAVAASAVTRRTEMREEPAGAPPRRRSGSRHRTRRTSPPGTRPRRRPAGRGGRW